MEQAPKIGIGIVTCDREHFFKQTFKSVNNALTNYSNHEYIVVNDGINSLVDPPSNTISTSGRQGVAIAKNIALKHLLEKECNYIFLIEDDVIIKRSDVFEKYILASKLSGIQHFNFAFHGRDNYNSVGQPAIKLRVEYSRDVAVCCYPNVYGAFSFYTKICLEKVGLMDVAYYNAMEHVDHTYFISKANMTTPFRWFADIADSDQYIGEIDRNHSDSVIRKDEKWYFTFKAGADRFLEKTKIDVTNPYQPVATKEQVINTIKQIKNEYSK
jgi:glycosyltransferase involved in cell wall biosynthesis